MSWSDQCSNCGNHRADCNCGDWNGYAKKQKLNNKMKELWKKYVRTNITEMRDLKLDETKESLLRDNVAISPQDMKLDNDTFKKGKIARSPNSHSEQWYINAKYVSEKFRLKES